MEQLHSFATRVLVAIDDVRTGERGQAMVEYALILFLVSIVSIAILSQLGGAVSSVFAEVNADF